jgi:hypothetical protein
LNQSADQRQHKTKASGKRVSPEHKNLPHYDCGIWIRLMFSCGASDSLKKDV